MLIKNHETLTCSPTKSRAIKNHEQSTTCFEISKGKSIEFKKQNRRYSQKCSHDEHKNQNLIFRPSINEIPFKLYPNSEGKNVNKSREEMRQRLLTDTTKTIHERLKAKFKLQVEQCREYSFHPKISSYAKQITRSSNNESTHERLFNEASQIRQQKLKTQKIKKEEQKKQIKRLLEYKLEGGKKNVLNEQKHNLRPIENRVKQIVQNRIKLRKKLLEQIESEKNINFNPEVSSKSQKLAEGRIQREKLKMDVVSRLMEEYQRMKRDKQSCLEIAKLKQAEQCTFNPQINRNYTFSRLHNDKSLFYERLERSHGSCQDEYLQYSFVPKINQMSDLIILHKRANQEMETKLQRLSKQPIQNKKQAIEKIRRQVQSNFTFRPQLNDITYMMTQACPKSHFCQQPPLEIFNFHPIINEKSKLIRPHRTESAKLRKKKKILEYKLESEYQELKQCSFHPKINNKRHRDERRLSLVEGVEKFMSFKQKAKQKVEMQRQRQMDLFHLQAKYDKRRDNKIFC